MTTISTNQDYRMQMGNSLASLVQAKTGHVLYSKDIDRLLDVVWYGDTWNKVLSHERDGLTDYTIEQNVTQGGVKILVVNADGETEWEAPTFDEAYNYIH